MKAIVVGKDPLPFMKFFEVGVGQEKKERLRKYLKKERP